MSETPFLPLEAVSPQPFPAADVIEFRRGAQSDEWLKLSLDRKVSPQGWYQESADRWVALIPNSFGLPAGESCPGRTEFCTSCYAHGSENSQGVAELVNHNYRLLTEAGSVQNMEVLLTEMVGRYVREADRRQVADKDRIFRIHWDGDFFSEDYAQAWANTIRRFSGEQFWAYTRSFVDPVNVVPWLSGIDNLTVYLSTDVYNAEIAYEVARDYPDVYLALCAKDYASARELQRPGFRTLVCPENIGRLALMDHGRGACVECRWCPDAKADIIFSTSHKEYENPQLSLFEEAIPVELKKKPAKLQ